MIDLVIGLLLYALGIGLLLLACWLYALYMSARETDD